MWWKKLLEQVLPLAVKAIADRFLKERGNAPGALRLKVAATSAPAFAMAGLGTFAAVVVMVLNYFWPGLGDVVDPQLPALVTAVSTIVGLIGAIAGYFTSEPPVKR